MSVANKSIRLMTFLISDKQRSVCRSIIKPTFLNLPGVIRARCLHTTKHLEAIVSFNLSDIGEGIRDVVIKEWFVKVGDKVSQFDNICEVQSDKASVTITSRYDGVIKKIYHEVDQVALVGKPLLDIEIDRDGESGETKPPETIKADEPVSTAQPQQQLELERNDEQEQISYALCIPSVRRLAKINKINLQEVKGTGKKGRILKEDILKYLESKKPDVKLKVTSRASRTVPVTGFQRAMVKTMTEALKIPHFLYCDEIAVTKLSKIRKAVKGQVEKEDVKLSFMPFFIKAASNSLLRYPVLNATTDANCENLTYHGAHNIGIAMDTKSGLAVPVIKNADQLSIMEIAKELGRLLKSGKEGNFSLDDMSGGSFTISNIGVIGGTYTSPIILPPQVAIIAIGASKTVPRFDASYNVVPEDIVCVSGAADHRVVDGATMANFITHFKKQIEDPNLLFLNL